MPGFELLTLVKQDVGEGMQQIIETPTPQLRRRPCRAEPPELFLSSSGVPVGWRRPAMTSQAGPTASVLPSQQPLDIRTRQSSDAFSGGGSFRVGVSAVPM